MSDYDTTEKVERTDKGYRLTIESTRGTGTRDQDKVKMEGRTEGYPDPSTVTSMIGYVKDAMAELRDFQPDGDDDE